MLDTASFVKDLNFTIFRSNSSYLMDDTITDKPEVNYTLYIDNGIINANISGSISN